MLPVDGSPLQRQPVDKCSCSERDHGWNGQEIYRGLGAFTVNQAFQLAHGCIFCACSAKPELLFHEAKRRRSEDGRSTKNKNIHGFLRVKPMLGSTCASRLAGVKTCTIVLSNKAEETNKVNLDFGDKAPKVETSRLDTVHRRFQVNAYVILTPLRCTHSL